MQVRNEVTQLSTLMQNVHSIGKIVHMNYTHATIASNDYYINLAGGIAKNSFLLATPTEENQKLNEVILLRVQGLAELDAARDMRIIREHLATNQHVQLDPMTVERMQICGYDCKIVGTFYEVDGTLTFGSDLDRVLAAQSYDVFKPFGESLSAIASYGRAGSLSSGDKMMMELGHVRYTETQKNPDTDAKVFVDVRDFIGKKTFFGGQSRTGKSNGIKVLAQQVFLYSRETNSKIGQIIFDPQGEYANDNAQDMGSSLASMGNGHDVVIYRTKLKGAGGYERQLLLNLLEEENIELLWDLMLIELRSGISASANYISGLNSVDFIKPDKTVLDSDEYKRLMNHYNRKRLALYAFLKNARFKGSVKNLKISLGKENNKVVAALHDDLYFEPVSSTVSVNSVDAAHKLFTWVLEQEKLDSKRKIDQDGNSYTPPNLLEPYSEPPVDDTVEQSVLNDSWLNDLRDGALTEFKKQFEQYEKGRSGVVAAFQRLLELHTNDSSGDLRNHIWEDVQKGRLIIVDLSKGSPSVITTLSELIVNHLINKSSELFTSGEKLVPYQIIVEEAHNLFSRTGAKDDSMDPWVRLSKEGAKYEIGLIYGTQEITGVDPRILSNTSNFICTHLNSQVEVRELSKYYSFVDWADQIISSESRGFARVKTESSPFIIPVQLTKFSPRNGTEEL